MMVTLLYDEDLDNVFLTAIPPAAARTPTTDGTESAPGALDAIHHQLVTGMATYSLEGDVRRRPQWPPRPSSCVEESTVTIDNDNTP